MPELKWPHSRPLGVLRMVCCAFTSESAPGTLVTTTWGLPGMYFGSSAAIRRACRSEPPPGAYPIDQVIVLPAKKRSASGSTIGAGAAAGAAAAGEAAGDA